jgi:hypothetical protein
MALAVAVLVPLSAARHGAGEPPGAPSRLSTADWLVMAGIVAVTCSHAEG